MFRVKEFKKTWSEGTTMVVQVFLNCLSLGIKALRSFETSVKNLHGVIFQNTSVLNSAALWALCLPQNQRQCGGGDRGGNANSLYHHYHHESRLYHFFTYSVSIWQACAVGPHKMQPRVSWQQQTQGGEGKSLLILIAKFFSYPRLGWSRMSLH